ncbi:cell envelope biogenesis protein YhbN [Nautilia profundicola AmH]|uniref:Cell envelope biogenesis protein YhbN n=1 Tax=Nautilia profundicola (strain ATCC BAA-1463 / DSM 18972 / AmH) TaxID=598659 RepID=B9LAD1_NAUPA|nr:lipopolysaccharide transport periplasmic protein LptA [Nautilia profundicola]ACM93437.1 cell envelope biogenesis protein YhbN [Nautilia profundicola AmH]
MKKILFVLMFLFICVNAEELKVTSKYFHYDMAKKESIFKGDVNATKGKDNILADEMIIFFDKNKKPLKFIATGNVRFVISLDKNATYKGRSDILVYQLHNGNIILKGNAKIVKLETNESVKGNKIILNRFTKNAEVTGGEKKPVEIIIKVNE